MFPVHAFTPTVKLRSLSDKLLVWSFYKVDQLTWNCVGEVRVLFDLFLKRNFFLWLKWVYGLTYIDLRFIHLTWFHTHSQCPINLITWFPCQWLCWTHVFQMFRLIDRIETDTHTCTRNQTSVSKTRATHKLLIKCVCALQADNISGDLCKWCVFFLSL